MLVTHQELEERREAAAWAEAMAAWEKANSTQREEKEEEGYDEEQWGAVLERFGY